MKRTRVIILGAAGRDFHNFNMVFRGNPNYEVVAFTATQIPDIAGRRYPKELSGKLYPNGIPIYPEEKLPELIKKFEVNQVVFAYSDVPHEYVMHKASIALANGADFVLLGPDYTMLKSSKPVISVTAVRTGAGKSQTSRAIAKILKKYGKKVVAIRHAMPYGNLTKQICQRFATEKDFKRYNTTIEEEEEYQPWIDNGFVVYAGVDYKKILREAEREASIIIFDGGNNDWSFVKPDLSVVVADPHRAGHELTYYPGFVNILLGNIIVINKIDSAKKENIELVKRNAKQYNPKAKIVLARSGIIVDNPELIKDKKCCIIGDGPTLSHGGMSFGAGMLAVKKYKGKIVDPRKYVVGSIKKTFEKYPHLLYEIPAMGYNKEQIKELERSVNRVPCDVVVDGTPANLKRIIKINKPIVNVTYELGKEAVKKLEIILKKLKFV